MPIVTINAVADCQKSLTTASMPIGSPTLTVAAPIFASGDVGKIIAVSRQDVAGGLLPWFDSGQGNTVIQRYLSPTQVILGLAASTAPTGSLFPTQSWPYDGTPAYVIWGTDNAPTIQAAINAAVASGIPPNTIGNYSTCFVPSGNFAIGTTIVLPSGINFRGVGSGSAITPIAVNSPGSAIAPSGQSSVVPAFCNTAYAVYGIAQATGPVDPAIMASGDNNISLSYMSIDMSSSSLGAGSYASRFYLLSGGTIAGVQISGNTNTGYEAPNLIGCAGVTVTNNTYTNVGYAFNPWCGCHDLTITNNIINIAYNSTPSTGSTYFAGPYCGIEINGIGTTPDDSQPTYAIAITNNTISLSGAAINAFAPVGIALFPDGPDCPMVGMQITNNAIYCSGAYNQGFFANAGQVGTVFNNNTIVGSDGGQGPYITSPISVAGAAFNIAGSSAIVDVVAVSGSSDITINWPGNGYLGTYSGQALTYFNVNGGPDAGGITLNGVYPIVAVDSASAFVAYVSGQTATATATISWNAAFATLSQFPKSMQINNNILLDCTAPDAPLLTIGGLNNQCVGNMATYQPDITPDHLCCVAWTAIPGNYAAGAVLNNVGVPGSGVVAGYLGDGLVCYAPYTNVPVIANNISGA